MAYQQVIRYKLAWNKAQQIGQAEIIIQSGVDSLTQLSSADFAAMGVMLNHSPVFYDPHTKWFVTDEEIPTE